MIVEYYLEEKHRRTHDRHFEKYIYIKIDAAKPEILINHNATQPPTERFGCLISVVASVALSRHLQAEISSLVDSLLSDSTPPDFYHFQLPFVKVSFYWPHGLQRGTCQHVNNNVAVICSSIRRDIKYEFTCLVSDNDDNAGRVTTCTIKCDYKKI